MNNLFLIFVIAFSLPHSAIAQPWNDGLGDELTLDPLEPHCDYWEFTEGSNNFYSYGTITQIRSNHFEYAVPSYGPNYTYYLEEGTVVARNVETECVDLVLDISFTGTASTAETWTTSTEASQSVAISAGSSITGGHTLGISSNWSDSTAYSNVKSVTYNLALEIDVEQRLVGSCEEYVAVPYVYLSDVVVDFGYHQQYHNLQILCDRNGDGIEDAEPCSGMAYCYLIEDQGFATVIRSPVSPEYRGTRPVPEGVYCPCDDGGGGGGGGGGDPDDGGSDGGGSDDGGSDGGGSDGGGSDDGGSDGGGSDGGGSDGGGSDGGGSDGGGSDGGGSDDGGSDDGSDNGDDGSGDDDPNDNDNDGPISSVLEDLINLIRDIIRELLA
jgi:hypothetical protein